MVQVRRRVMGAAVVLALAVGETAADDKVELTNGDVLNGTILQADDDVVIVDHATLGRMEIPRDEIKGYTWQKTADELIVEPPPPPKTEIDYWDLSLDLSFTATTGNTREVNLRFGVNANRNTDAMRLALDFSYYWRTSNSITTDNKATLGARNDWLIPDSKWFWFVAGRADYDQFESWDYRVNAQGGPGYQLFDEENLKLNGTGGLGFRKEFGSLDDELKFEGVLAMDLEWNLTKRQAVTFNFSCFPVMTDIQDFRTRSTALWRYALDTDYALSLVIGYLWEYQSIVDPGKDRNDFRFWVGLQYGF